MLGIWRKTNRKKILAKELTVKPRLTDIRLIRTPRYIRTVCFVHAVSLNPTRLIRTLYMAHSVSVLTGI